MSKNRDEFSKPIRKVLAERVAYICSNPNCKKTTIGPNVKKDKSTSIGVAAHITAAAPGGPRYDASLTPAERSDIDNGIWLCSNCSILIDKDELSYPAALLKAWKIMAENDMRQRITYDKHGLDDSISKRRPKVEAVLLWDNTWSFNEGVYEANNETPIIADSTKFVFRGKWEYKLLLINNSSIPAFNVKIYQDGEYKLNIKTPVVPVNNLQSLGEMHLECVLEHLYVMTGEERRTNDVADKPYPQIIENILLRIEYEDEDGKRYITTTTFLGKEPQNTTSAIQI